MVPPRPPRHAAPAPAATSPHGVGGPDATAAPRRRWKLNVATLIVGLIALAGLFGAMYPSTAAWWSSYNQSKVLEANARVTKLNVAPGNEARIQEAHEYNALLASGAVTVGADSNKPTTDGSDSEGDLLYDDMLSGPYGYMARIKIPSIDVDLPVYHGTSDEVLKKGAGHLQGTSLPVGGIGTHSAISAHRGLATATMFDNLNKVRNRGRSPAGAKTPGTRAHSSAGA